MNKFIKILFILLILFFVFIFILHRSGAYKIYTSEELRGNIPYTKIYTRWDWEKFRSYLRKLYEDFKNNVAKFLKE